MINQKSPFHTVLLSGAPNMALNPVRFALWTLRDKAAQRRLALRWASLSGFAQND